MGVAKLKRILNFDIYTCLGFAENMSSTHIVKCQINRAWRHGIGNVTHVFTPSTLNGGDWSYLCSAIFADRIVGIMRLIAREATWVSKVVLRVVVPITENGTPTIQRIATHPLVYKTYVTECAHFIKFDKCRTAAKPICCFRLTRTALTSTSCVR
jgi:hypothetical protein